MDNLLDTKIIATTTVIQFPAWIIFFQSQKWLIYRKIHRSFGNSNWLHVRRTNLSDVLSTDQVSGVFFAKPRTPKCILDISGSFFTPCEHALITPSCHWRSHQRGERKPYSQLCLQQQCECSRFLHLRSFLKQLSFDSTRLPVGSKSGGTAGRPGARLARPRRSEGTGAAERATEIRPWTSLWSARPRLWRRRRSALRSYRLSLQERRQVAKVKPWTSLTPSRSHYVNF